MDRAVEMPWMCFHQIEDYMPIVLHGEEDVCGFGKFVCYWFVGKRMRKMNFVKRDDLAVITLRENEERIPFSLIREAMLEKETHVVYYQRFGRIVGKTDIYDLVGSGKEKLDIVAINPNVNTISSANCFQAQDFFENRRNKNWRYVAVISEDKELLGEYRFADDYDFARTKQSFIEQVKKNKGDIPSFAKKDIFVRPMAKRKRLIFDEIVEMLSQEKHEIHVVEAGEVPKLIEDKNMSFLFADFDDYDLTRAVYRHPLHGRWGMWKHKFDAWEKLYSDMVDVEILRSVIAEKHNISIYTINCRHKGTDWRRRFNSRNRKYHVLKGQEAAFFAEEYTEEYAKLHRSFHWEHRRLNGVNSLKDVESPLLNIKNGERRVCDTPAMYERTLWFFGACTVVGAFVEDKYTIESLLQKKINEMGISCRVRNCGAWGGVIGRLLETKFQDGDILVIFTMEDDFSDYFPTLSLEEIAQKHHLPFDWFTDDVSHCNWKANLVWTEELWHLLEKDLVTYQKPNKSKSFYFDKGRYLQKAYFDRYFPGYAVKDGESVGSIVMNCNPFTKGHRYLIERSASQVDRLIVFVVEEDRSDFSFVERFSMVVVGAEDLKNVLVVPGGAFILSQTTFPEYFIKIKDEDIVQNVDFDIEIFAKYIAKPLGITHRFVGEEKNDEVTAEYNKAMQRILPKFGIEVVEISRVTKSEEIISASVVRRHIKEGELSRARALLPSSTRKFLGLETMSEAEFDALHRRIDKLEQSFAYDSDVMAHALYFAFSMRPTHILEFGVDNVTKLTIGYANRFHVRHMVLDYDRDRVLQFLRKEKLPLQKTSIYGSPLLSAKIRDKVGVVYRDFNKITEGQRFELIVLKCPFGGGRRIHLDVLPKLPDLLSGNFVILMDHVEDACGEFVFGAIRNILGHHNIDTDMKEFHIGERKICVVFNQTL